MQAPPSLAALHELQEKEAQLGNWRRWLAELGQVGSAVGADGGGRRQEEEQWFAAGEAVMDEEEERGYSETGTDRFVAAGVLGRIVTVYFSVRQQRLRGEDGKQLYDCVEAMLQALPSSSPAVSLIPSQSPPLLLTSTQVVMRLCQAIVSGLLLLPDNLLSPMWATMTTSLLVSFAVLPIAPLELWRALAEMGSTTSWRGRITGARVKAVHAAASQVAPRVMVDLGKGLLGAVVCGSLPTEGESFERIRIGMRTMLSTLSAGFSGVLCLGVAELKLFASIARAEGSNMVLTAAASDLLIEAANVEGTPGNVVEFLSALMTELSEWCLEASRKPREMLCDGESSTLFSLLSVIVSKQLRRIEGNGALTTALEKMLGSMLTMTEAVLATGEGEAMKGCRIMWEHVVDYVMETEEAAIESGAAASAEASLRCGAIASYLKVGLLKVLGLFLHSIMFHSNERCLDCLTTTLTDQIDADPLAVYIYRIIDAEESGLVEESELSEYINDSLIIVENLIHIYGSELFLQIFACAERSIAAASTTTASTYKSLHDVATTMGLLACVGSSARLQEADAERIRVFLSSGLQTLRAVCSQISNTKEMGISVHRLAMSSLKTVGVLSGMLSELWLQKLTPDQRNAEAASLFSTICSCINAQFLGTIVQLQACSTLRSTLKAWECSRLIDEDAVDNLRSTLANCCLNARSSVQNKVEAALWANSVVAMLGFRENVADSMPVISAWLAPLHLQTRDDVLAAIETPSLYTAAVPLEMSRIATIVSSLVKTCDGVSRDTRRVIYQALVEPFLGGWLIMFTHACSIDDEVVAACLLRTYVDILRALRVEIGGSTALQSSLPHILKASFGKSCQSSRVIFMVLQVLLHVVREPNLVKGTDMQGILHACSTGRRLLSAQSKDPKDKKELFTEIECLVYLIPLECLANHWSYFDKVTKGNPTETNQAAEHVLNVIGSFNATPCPPPSTLRSFLDSLAKLCKIRPLFKAHWLEGLKGEAMRMLLQALISGRHDALADGLIDILVGTLALHDWDLFLQRVIPATLASAQIPMTSLDALNLRELPSTNCDAAKDIVDSLICSIRAN